VIPRHSHFATAQLVSDPGGCEKVYQRRRKSSYSILVQSKSAGTTKRQCARDGTLVGFDVARQRRIQGLTWRGNPIKHCTFQAFRVVGPCAGRAFLIWGNGIAHMVIIGSEETRTSSAICLIFSSEPLSRRSSSPGTI